MPTPEDFYTRTFGKTPAEKKKKPPRSIAYQLGGGLVMFWPFYIIAFAMLNASGANIPVTGPQNWADTILAYCSMLSYTGPLAIALVIFCMYWGYHIGGNITEQFLRNRARKNKPMDYDD